MRRTVRLLVVAALLASAAVLIAPAAQN